MRKRAGKRRTLGGEDAAESWPAAAAAASPQAWARERSRFGRLIGRLARLAKGTPGALERRVPVLHSSQTGNASSLESVLWQTLVHNSPGQVVLVRRALGAWPPEAGSDTWQPAPATAPSGAFVDFSCAKSRVVSLSGNKTEMSFAEKFSRSRSATICSA